jgi:hypothetical protein
MIITELARKCKCDPITIRRWIKKENIETIKELCLNNKTANGLNDNRCQEFIQWWQSREQVPEGYITLAEICRNCDVDRGTIVFWIKNNNINYIEKKMGNGPLSKLIHKDDFEKFKKIFYASDKAISVNELLEKYKCNWRAANRWAKRNNKQFVKVKGKNKSQKGLLPKDAKQFEKYLIEIKEGGFLYAIQLIPEYNQNRIKFGFAYDPERRLADHKITCPNAKLLGNWKCLRHLEKTSIKKISEYFNGIMITSEIVEFPNDITLNQLNNVLGENENF